MRLRTAILSALLATLAHAPAFAEKRVALVIGNSAYERVTQLANPTNDADMMAQTLRSTGFNVDLKRNLRVNELRRALRDFSDSARDADVAVVYFAGHGMEIDGINYIIPTDAVLERDIDAFDEAVPLERLLTVIEPAKQLRLVILDACRDNPFNRTMQRTVGTRAISRGLARVDLVSPNTLVAFAAKAGSTASDGDTRNSPFTSALVKHLPRPGLDLRKALGFARDDVMKATNNRQEPFVYGSLGGEDVVLVAAPAVPAASVVPADPEASARRDYEYAAQVGTREAWESFLATYPTGFYSGLARAQQSKLVAAPPALPVSPPPAAPRSDDKLAALTPPATRLDDKTPISDILILREIQTRLYELNFDPGSPDQPFGDAARASIREFEENNALPVTGQATADLLRRLRATGDMKPWGTLIYAKGTNKWGISWGHQTRKAAVESARASCGDAKQCQVELSFFGQQCGTFAHSPGNAFSMISRSSVQASRDAAVADCNKRGATCRIIASVCADGSGLQSANR